MADAESLPKEGHFDTISRQKPISPQLQPPSSEEYMSSISREPVFNKIMEALKDSNVEMIGVYGIGGVCKTTMVTKVGEQVKKDKLFDEVVMAVVSQNANVADIQDQLAAQLDLKLEEESEVRRGIRLWKRLNNRMRNLVILDDVWEELNLKEIGIPIKDGKKGCKVVLTSQNRHVLKTMAVHGDLKEVYRDFSIKELPKEEAWNLFKNKMGNNVDPCDPLHDIAREVCGECGGLPIAILAVAAALKGKPMPVWESSLVQLKEFKLNRIEGIDPKLFNALRLSYDYLESENAKLCFLLCCSFPEDALISIGELVRHCMTRRLFHDQNPDTLEEARDSVCSVVHTRKTSCLLLDGGNDDFVKMHDVVRDVAILIAKEKKAYLVKHGVKKWPEKKEYGKFLAISLTCETILKLPNKLVCQELQMLMLDCGNGKIPDRFFSETKKLVVLELNRGTGSSLPSSLGKLTELRMLCLNECKLGDIATLKHLKNTLEILRLRGSNITVLPLVVGELTCLRLLDLGDCHELEEIPSGVISKLDRLEELHFPRDFDNWEGTTDDEDNNSEGKSGDCDEDNNSEGTTGDGDEDNNSEATTSDEDNNSEEISKVSLDELKLLTRLSTLYIFGVPYFSQLPIDPCFQNLIRFDIEVGEPSPPLRLEEECSSQGVMRVEGICSDDDFKCWKRLLGKPKWSNNLTQLVIRDCGLKYLFSPSSARELHQLQHLLIEGSEIMEAVIGNEGENDEEIIEDVINFSQLKILRLIDNPCLISFFSRIKKATIESHFFAPTQSFFNEKVAFPSLEDLEIDGVPTIIAIWDMQTFPIPEKAADSPFSQLKALSVQGCPDIVNVVQGIPNMEARGVNEMKGKQVNHNYVLQFPRLRNICLVDLGRLSSFNDTSRTTKTQSLFNHEVAFPALEELYIDSVPNVTAIIFSEEREEQTQEAMKKDVILFPKLTSLTLFELTNLEGICAFQSEGQLYFNLQVAFPALQKLHIKSVHRITTIWGMQAFSVPKSATDSSFSQSMNNTTSVTTVTQPLFSNQVAFPAFRALYIHSMPNLTEIWEKNPYLPTGSFCQLEELEVSGCEKLMNVIPPHIPPPLNTKRIIVDRCPKMEVIIVLEERKKEAQEAIVFPKLEWLGLFKLGKLKGICAYKSKDQLNFNVQVKFRKKNIYDVRYFQLDGHSRKIVGKATSNKKDEYDSEDEVEDEDDL